jgi:hypothetical protein
MRSRAGNAVKDTTTTAPFEGLRWDCSWETAEAQRLFASVREFCGVYVGEPELTPEMIETALQEAREILEPEPEEPDEADRPDKPEQPPETEKPVENAEKPAAGPGWRKAAVEYHRAHGGRVLEVEIEPERLQRLRRLLTADDVSLQRADSEINSNRLRGRAADSTVEALMYSLRERGVKALDEAGACRRLAELSDEQTIEVGRRLRKLKPEIARPWTADEVSILMQTCERVKK